MKRRVWRWVLGIVVVLSAAVGGLFWSAHSRATAVFEAQDRKLVEEIARIRTRSLRRAGLYTPSKPGDGWRLFRNAMAVLDALPAAETEEIPGFSGDPDFVPDPEILEDLFEKYAPLVEQFRESNRCADFRPEYHYEAGVAMDLPATTSALQSARFFAARAVHFVDSGRDAGALESLALGFAAGQDAAQAGPLISHLIHLICDALGEEALRGLLAAHAFKARDLESFASTLDRLSVSRSSLMEALAVDDVTLRRTLTDLGLLGSDEAWERKGLGWGRSWRYLYSRRLACAGALGELERLYARMQGLSDLPPHGRTAEMDKIVKDGISSRNPIVEKMMPAVGKCCRQDLIAAMSWTLMRVSVAIAWYQAERGALPATLNDLTPKYLMKVPPCPFTGLPLGYRDGRVWSPGVNGVDDGGKPGKDNEADAPDGDVVWTVKRK